MEVTMIINPKVLNIPPFISVQWNQIEFLTTEGEALSINLKSGKTVIIPELTVDLMQKIFHMHGTYAEVDRPISLPPIPPIPQSPLMFGSSGFKIAFSASENGFGLPLQHMEELREAPNLPTEVLEKVKTISKLVPAEEITNSPKPVEHCNCPFCQIASAIHSDFPHSAQSITVEVIEEPIDDQELKFNDWNISQKGDQLFEVQSKLDTNESYSVFLGDPVGCSCGKNGCEHILAVLKS